MTMTLSDRKRDPVLYPTDDIESLREGMHDLRSVVARMDRVLDRMEDKEKQGKPKDA